MATQTLTTQLTASCVSNSHHDITLTLNGGSARVIRMSNADILDQLTEDDLQSYIRVVTRLTRIAKGGNMALTKTALQAGVSLVVA